MSRPALEETKFELIKAHVLDPDNSPLSAEKYELLERVISASKVLDKNPIQKQAVAIHQQKYPGISRSQAYEDLRLAAANTHEIAMVEKSQTEMKIFPWLFHLTFKKQIIYR
jgi:hypothetical protein